MRDIDQGFGFVSRIDMTHRLAHFLTTFSLWFSSSVMGRRPRIFFAFESIESAKWVRLVCDKAGLFECWFHLIIKLAFSFSPTILKTAEVLYHLLKKEAKLTK